MFGNNIPVKILKYILIVVLLSVPMLSLAAEFRAGDNPSIIKDERIINDVYIAGGSVSSAGNVIGDLIAGGGAVLISGDVSQDLFVGGGNVNILSNITDDARIGGGTVTITGRVGGDLMVGGGQVTISGSGVGGDVVIGGGSIRLDSSVAGDLLIAGGEVYINSLVSGNVNIKADKITLGKNAVISGNLTYESSKELVKETGAVVKGTTDFKLRSTNVDPQKAFEVFSSIFLLWKSLTLLVCGLVFGFVFRRYGKEITAIGFNNPLRELGKGLIAVIVIPIASMLLLVTLVGFPFGIAGLLGFIISMLFAWILTPIILGSIVYKYFSKKELEISWKTVILGVFLYIILGILPFIGNLAQILLMLLTLGCMVTFKMQILKDWR